MSDPIRLLSRPPLAGASTRELELLASARDDQAPLDAEERALAMLGLGAVAAGVASSAASSSAASSSAASGSSVSATTGASFAPAGVSSTLPAAAKITGLAFAKWVGVGVIAVAAAAGTYKVVAPRAGREDAARTQQALASTPAPTATVARSGVAFERAPVPATVPSPPDPVVVAKLDEAPAAPARDDRAGTSAGTELTAPTPPAHGAAAPVDGAGQLTGELALLDRARGALAQRNPAASSAALDEYARKYPNGTMREEATVARIETLLLAGQNAQASIDADQFLREHPSSTNTKRVRQLKKRAPSDN